MTFGPAATPSGGGKKSKQRQNQGQQLQEGVTLLLRDGVGVAAAGDLMRALTAANGGAPPVFCKWPPIARNGGEDDGGDGMIDPNDEDANAPAFWRVQGPLSKSRDRDLKVGRPSRAPLCSPVQEPANPQTRAAAGCARARLPHHPAHLSLYCAVTLLPLNSNFKLTLTR